MSQFKDTTDLQATKAGAVMIEESRGKISLYAYNHERQGKRHIGSIIGVTYEKAANVLMQPEPSFTLTESEFAAVESCGAQFIRIIPNSKRGTYTISFQDFKRNMVSYYSRGYGPQWRVPLSCPSWQFTSKIAPRNPIVDNPVIERPGPIAPRDRQLKLPWGG